MEIKILIFSKSFQVILIYIFFYLPFQVNNKRNIYMYQSEINLIIKGIGQISFLNEKFYRRATQVIVNGNSIDPNINYYNFIDTLNNVTIKFDGEITSCKNMFNGLKNIKEIDLSNFDTSKVTDMDSMFYLCTNLEKINFGNINTSLVKNMKYLFHYCYNLSSIDVSNFDTSSVTTTHSMFRFCTSLTSINVSNFNTHNMVDITDIFGGCSKLTSIDLSNFDTSKVKYMQGLFFQCYQLRRIDLRNFNTSSAINLVGIFHYCNSLVYVNLDNFIIKENANISRLFLGVNKNVKICVNNEEARLILKTNNSNLSFDCSDICFNENIKIDLKNNQCIESCKISDYKYEYDNYCYEKCPNNTFVSINKEYSCQNKKMDNGYYYDNNSHIYKECFNTCKSCNEGGNETTNNCIECKSGFIFLDKSIYIPDFLSLNNILDNTNCYKQCEFYYYFNEQNRYQCTENKSCPENFNKLIIDKNICIDECKKDNIYKYEYNNICVYKCPNETFIDEVNYICVKNEYLESTLKKKEYIETNEITEIILLEKQYKNPNDFVNYIQNMLLDDFNTTDIDNGDDYVYTREGGKIIFTLTTPSNQKNNKNNSTKIYLNECEDKIKKEYNISENNSLYILKVDNYLIEGRKTPNVEYEIYYPSSDNKLKKANLSLCNNIKIDISIPLNISLNELDIYNASSPLYNDICYTITSENGTDKCLNDRRNEFVDNNLSVCEEGCEFNDYDNFEKRAICSCSAKTSFQPISEVKKDNNKIFSNFIDINNIANIKMLKCIYLLFDINNIFKNYANYLLVILLINGILSALVFCCYNSKKIKEDIQQIWVITMEKKQVVKKENNSSVKKIIISGKKYVHKQKLNKNAPTKKNLILSKIEKKHKDDINLLGKTNINNIKFLINNNKDIKKSSIFNSNFNNDISNRVNPLKLKINPIKEKKLKSTKKSLNVIKIDKNDKSHTDNELNSLDFSEALKYDQRNFIQYYMSLLKYKNLLIYTFIKCNDYNSQMIKIYCFFFSFAMNYSVSAIFYSDETMHKIYVDSGYFDIIYQLPQMLYSSVISFFLGFLIDFLSSYEDDILNIKRYFKEKNISKNIIKKVYNCITIKIIFFFIISYLLSICFWIYLGCFCAVYKNTQIHLLKEVLFSFLISIISPFLYYLLPAIFRIVSFKYNIIILYKLSKFFQFF